MRSIFTLLKEPGQPNTWHLMICLLLTMLFSLQSNAQITLLRDYENNESAPIGTFQGINFREAGFSGLYAIPNTNGKEFWTVSDRGVNVDAANANPDGCHPTYDKIYGFPTYAPKIHRIKLKDDGTIQILQSITMKRPNGTTATGLINPTGFGSTAAEVASTDTVLNCANFNSKIAEKDVWGIDSEGIIVDKQGYFWICEEGGPTIWKLNPNGVVVKRFTPYANKSGAEPQDVQIDSVFKYRKNNRGFEGISITPNGKIYAIIQSPVLYPTKAVGEGTRIHRILEIDPATNATRMFAYINDGIIGTGSNQIRLRDWKIGDMAAINDHEFLVLEAGLRGTTDIKKMYKIDISGATPVTSGLYSGKTLEALVDEAGLTANSIAPVSKTLFMNLLTNGWNPVLDKAEGIAILNDSTIAICNDNDFGQSSPLENGIATATTNKSHMFIYGLQGENKLNTFVPLCHLTVENIAGPVNACAYTGNLGGIATYSVATKDAAAFSWKIPAKATLISGQGTNTIKIKYQGSFTTGVLSVKVSSACGEPVITRSISIHSAEPAVPAVISGPASICEYTGTNTVATYSIDSVANSVYYNWVLPPHAILVAGQGTTSIKVKFLSRFTTSDIRVSAVSGCGWSAYQTLKVTSSAPERPVAIVGQTHGICGPSNSALYYIEPVKFATSYAWSFSVPGATIVASDSATAMITFPDFVSGVISVKANNSCGSSVSRILVVHSRPEAPRDIDGPANACVGSVQTYSTSVYPEDSTTNYIWSVPLGSVIQSGAGTSTITVLTGSHDGDIKVKVANECGVTLTKSLFVDADNCNEEASVATEQVSAYPSPTNGPMNIRFNTTQNESSRIYVTDVITGSVVFSKESTSTSFENESTVDLSALRNGIYILHVVTGSKNHTQRIEIRH